MSLPATPSASENHLARETSPYLLQHKDNPVAWWPWGPDALAEAKRTGKPILLSVGYAACHWCHVMAHESFEDAATAAVMNELFVNIKVDREERPDIDQIYMSALHHLGEHGGWPLTMFLTSAGEPVWGGTYFPKTSRYGKPAFTDVLREVARIFREEPDKVGQNRDALMARLAERARPEGRVTVGAAELDRLARQVGGAFDPVHGGLRGAPKFPNASIYEMVWRAGMRSNPPPAQRWGGSANAEGVSRGGGTLSSSQAPPTPDPSPPLATLAGGGEQAAPRSASDGRQGSTETNQFFRVIEHTLERICEGGIFDHLGGGFSRYSVDERWLVPHFEKMLYDNAQLLELLALAHQRSGNPLFRQRARETVAWLAREMTTGEGAFSASLDADSEGEEGKFYVWSRAEIADVLGEDDAAFFAQHYDVTDAGNFEGHNILNRLGGPRHPHPNPPPQAGEGREGAAQRRERSAVDETRLAALREKLLAVRASRVRPGLDDKVLADWNGLMIAALVNAGTMLGEPDWIARAGRAFDFIAREMARGDRLGHSWREGRLLFPGLASDFACMIRAALALHEATGERRYLDKALDWQVAFDSHYANEQTGGYYLTADDAEGLVVRPASTSDDATPNPNAVAAGNLVRLATLTGDITWRERTDALIEGVLAAAGDHLLGHAALLNAIDLRLNAAEIVVTGKNHRRFADAALKLPYLNRIVLRAPSADALAASHPAQAKVKAGPGSAAFVCVGERCSLPVTNPDKIAEAVAGMRAA